MAASGALVVYRVVFAALGCLMVGTLVYTCITDGSPFRTELLTPWMVTTLVDFYVNIAAISTWVVYKEGNWISSIFRVALLICFGSATTCAYIVSKLFEITSSGLSQNPLDLLLLRQDNLPERKCSFVVIGRTIFSILGILMAALVAYTVATDGLPFRKDLLTPWMAATLIDFYINVFAISVWVVHRESTWISALIWICLLICFGRCEMHLTRAFARAMPPEAIGTFVGEAGERTRGQCGEAPYGKVSAHGADSGVLALGPQCAIAGEVDSVENGVPTAGSQDEAGVGTHEGDLTHLRWIVNFEDTTLHPRRVLQGSVRLNLRSRWLSLWDEEEDIIAGTYLLNQGNPKVGDALEFDGFLVNVQIQKSLHTFEQPKVCVDLTSSTPRFGGRFWVLADHDQDSDEEVLEEGMIDAEGRSPLPGPKELRSSSADVQLVKQRTPAGMAHVCRSKEKACKPWIGPIPKVVFRATALIRMWSLLTPVETREPLVTGCARWEMVAQGIFNRFGWRHINRIGP